MRAFVVFFCTLMLSISEVNLREVPFQNCASQKEHGEVTSVDVTPCDEDPCIFKHGTNETVAVSFIPHEVVTRAKILAYAIKWGMRFPLPLPNPNACQGYGMTCPLKSSVPVKLTFTQEVSESAPSGSYKLEAILTDQNGDTIICGIFQIKIT